MSGSKTGTAPPSEVLADVGVKAKRIRAIDEQVADTLQRLKKLRGERANLLTAIIAETADPDQYRLSLEAPAEDAPAATPKGKRPPKAKTATKGKSTARKTSTRKTKTKGGKTSA